MGVGRFMGEGMFAFSLLIPGQNLYDALCFEGLRRVSLFKPERLLKEVMP